MTASRGFDLSAVEHVGGPRQRGGAILLDGAHGGLGPLATAAKHAYLRPGPREPARQGGAEHPRTAGDDGDLPFQTEQFCRQRGCSFRHT